MPQDNELIEKFRAKRAERTAQRKARGDRRRLIIVGSAVGAALLLAAILCLIFIRPAPDTDPTTARRQNTAAPLPSLMDAALIAPISPCTRLTACSTEISVLPERLWRCGSALTIQRRWICPIPPFGSSLTKFYIKILPGRFFFVPGFFFVLYSGQNPEKVSFGLLP